MNEQDESYGPGFYIALFLGIIGLIGLFGTCSTAGALGGL